MAAPRRSKSLTPDGQTAKFLYSILKQLDLKAVDWTQVAEAIGITNGHAARMRYSRFKSQIEGAPAYAKKEKAKKADCKDKFSDNYDYGKRKREDDSQMPGQESKIMKVEPCFHPQWPYAFQAYGQPMPMQYYQQQLTMPQQLPQQMPQQTQQQMPYVPPVLIKDEPPSQLESIAEARPTADEIQQQTSLSVQPKLPVSEQVMDSIPSDAHTRQPPTSPKPSSDIAQAENQCEKEDIKKEPEAEVLPIEVIDEEQPIWRPSTPDSLLNLLPLISPSMFSPEPVSNHQDHPASTSDIPSEQTPANVAAPGHSLPDTVAPLATRLILNTTEPSTNTFNFPLSNQAPSASFGHRHMQNYRLPSLYSGIPSARGYWQQGQQPMYAQNYHAYPGQRPTYAATPRVFGYPNTGQQPIYYPPSPYNQSNQTVTNDGNIQKNA